MRRICIVTGSRADKGLLEWPAKVLSEYFEIEWFSLWGLHFYEAAGKCREMPECDLVLLLGDRFEVLAAAIHCHLNRIPIAHVGGGDVSEGSYDDAMRDCISRMATWHFCTSQASVSRLTQMGCRNGYFVGNPAIDYIRFGPWRDSGTPAIGKPYVLVAYYPETIDDTVDLEAVEKAIDGRSSIWIKPNLDRGMERIPGTWEFSHDQFISVLANCEEFIGNSSALLYYAPELGIKTRMIGKRQRGRVIPEGDGKASERIARVLRYA